MSLAGITLIRKKIRWDGYTLVEILVALVIGLFLIAGLTQFVVGTRNIHRVVNNLSELQENGRFAIDLLARHIRMAGFRSDWQSQVTKPWEGVDGPSGAPDQITVRYESASDCTGAAVVGTPPIAVNTFAIAASNGVLNLRCTGNEATPQPMVMGVEDMQIQYGVDADNDGAVNYYTSAPPNNVSQVLSMSVQLVLMSRDSRLADLADGRLRRTFSTTVTMRNSAVASAQCPPHC